MSGFSLEWLALREEADHAARDRELTRELVNWGRRRDGLRIADLGAGTGANLRYLAPHLGHAQEWHLIDNDAVLLAGALDALSAWSKQRGHEIREQGAELYIEAEQFSARVIRARSDLAGGIQRLPLLTLDVITASALLDLASAAWIDSLALACQHRSCAAMLVLNYDGRVTWRPALRRDGQVTAGLNRHQCRDKGLGTALGPRAGHHALRRFSDGGFEVRAGRSDWQLGNEQAALQRELARGWVQAVVELEPAAGAWSQAWLCERIEAVADDGAGLNVGHVDLLALPPEA